MKLPTVTIGIPAYNEHQNLTRFIAEILSQNKKNYNLENIFILSDGSTDGTDNLANELKFSILKILGDKKRKGKPFRINQLFKKANSDLVIIFDADIHLIDKQVIDNLVFASFSHKNSLISGFAVPNTPKTLPQKIAFAGVNIWDSIRLSDIQSEIYRCEGSIRLFPKSLYKKIVFPSTSADEAFSYIKVKALGGGFFFNKKAKINYTLPKSFKDYISQQRRYSNSQSIQVGNFNDLDIKSFFTVSTKDRLLSTIQNLKNDHIYTLLYLFFITFIKISVKFFPTKSSSLWKILSTTK